MKTSNRGAEAFDVLERALPLARLFHNGPVPDRQACESAGRLYAEYSVQSMSAPKDPGRRKLHDEQLQTLERFQKAWPESRYLASDLGELLGHRAGQLRLAKDYAEMARDAERACELEATPSSRYLRAYAWGKTRRIADAAAEALALDRGPPPFVRIKIAMLHAMLAGQSDPPNEEYLQRAVAALAEARRQNKLSPAALKQLLSDDDFAPLRNRPEIQALLESSKP